MKNANDFITKLTTNPEHNKGALALDLGCGEGTYAIELAKLGYFVHAVDHSKKAIEALDDKWSLSSGPLKVIGHEMKVEDYKIVPNTYAVIVARNVLPFFKDKNMITRILTDMANGLMVGGKMHFTLFGHEDAWAGKKENMSFFEYDEFMPLMTSLGLKPYFTSTEKGYGKTIAGNIKYWNIHRYTYVK